MQRVLLILLALCILFSFCGCNAAPDDSPDDTGSSTTAPSVPSIPQADLFTVAVPVITETAAADDGTTLFSYTFQNMSLTMPNPDIADKIIIDFLNRIDKTRSSAESLLRAARAAYSPGMNWNPYQYHITYSPTRIDYSVLSMFGSNTSYSGASHPESTYVSVNYDLVSGSVLTLGNILTETATVDALYACVMDALSVQEKDKYLYIGYEDAVKSRFSIHFSDDTAWYFSQNGLCFYFSPYEIAPYASGVITAEIPYAKLSGILNDAYFPPEREAHDGIVSLLPATEENLEQFTQFAELILDDKADSFLLYTDTVVYDVVIETATYSTIKSEYEPQHTVFACAGLTPGDAIHIQSSTSVDSNILILTYRSGDSIFTSHIFKDPNGNLQLVADMDS